MQNLCRQLQVSSIDEIIALIALYRPGPMEWIPDYIRGKKDPSTVKFPHTLLEDVCRETYGVMVYQEQVMEAAKIIAGYSLGGADMLRRAMGKKDPVAMAEERGKFVSGAKKLHNIDEKTSDAIFDILNKFAGYGFNKSHSAAYALLSYQTAFLKANHPVQFMAAMLSSELGNSDKVAHFVAECESMGLEVLGPDVNESREMFTPVGGKIRFGLAGIKGVGELAAQRIIAEREANGPFVDFDDFATRVDGRAVNKRVLEHLVKTGAFDFSRVSRRRLFEGIDAAIAASSAQARDRAAGQDNFLGTLADPPAERNSPRTKPEAAHADFTAHERLTFEKELLGFYVSGHPMNSYSGLWEAIDTAQAEDLAGLPDRGEFRLCGIAANLAKKYAKKDNRPWVAFTLATRKSTIALNMFADAFASFGSVLSENAAVLVQGNIIRGADGPRVNVKECYPLDLAVARTVRKVTWLLKPDHPDLEAFMHELREAIVRDQGDTRIEFAVLLEGGVAPIAEASAALSWRLTANVFQKLRSHPSVAGIRIETRPLELKPDTRWARR
jgi:DNA polymerase-3 subunit alpha